MTRDEFIAAGVYLYGPKWRSKMAETLCVDRSSVSRWASGATDVLPLAAVCVRILVKLQQDRESRDERD